MPSEGGIEDRRTKAGELLARQGFMSLAELVDILDVSESTIRRDLEALEQQGLVRRTHGGAVYIKDTGGQAYAFADRETTAADEKQAIGRAVAELITDGQAVLLDGGTTCYQVARAIAGRHLSVVTNALPIASLLSGEMATEVTLIGGYVYPRTGVALGSMAEQQVAVVHGSQLVLSCAGVAEDGVYNQNEMMVGVERQMMAVADEVILAVDHTKFGRRAVARLCDLSEVHVIVTDDGLDGPTRRWLESLEARLILATTTEESP